MYCQDDVVDEIHRTRLSGMQKTIDNLWSCILIMQDHTRSGASMFIFLKKRWLAGLHQESDFNRNYRYHHVSKQQGRLRQVFLRKIARNGRPIRDILGTENPKIWMVTKQCFLMEYLYFICLVTQISHELTSLFSVPSSNASVNARGKASRSFKWVFNEFWTRFYERIS
jgi:hypothetical protein